MRSSQALTQSVFGALVATGHFDVLEGVIAECGRPAFAGDLRANTMASEKHVTWLAEPRPTTVDVWLEAPTRRIAVECKLTESVAGRFRDRTATQNIAPEPPLRSEGARTYRHFWAGTPHGEVTL